LGDYRGAEKESKVAIFRIGRIGEGLKVKKRGTEMKLYEVAMRVLPVAMALSGCAAQLEKEAIMKLQSDCAAMGRQFVKVSSETSDNIVSKATVSGACVGPGDPRYVAPPISTNAPPR
jgi:hypothetical protein